jgi:hypothetical protein
MAMISDARAVTPSNEEETLDTLRALVEANRVEEARSLAASAVQRWPDSPPVKRWAHVLAPPKATKSQREPFRNLETERAWLLKHSHEYPGCWIAVSGDQLVAADPDLDRVHAAIRDSVGNSGAVIWFQSKNRS